MPETLTPATALTSASCARNAADCLNQARLASPDYAPSLIGVARGWMDLGVQLDQHPNMQSRPSLATGGIVRSDGPLIVGQRGPE